MTNFFYFKFSNIFFLFLFAGKPTQFGNAEFYMKSNVKHQGKNLPLHNISHIFSH